MKLLVGCAGWDPLDPAEKFSPLEGSTDEPQLCNTGTALEVSARVPGHTGIHWAEAAEKVAEM